MSYYLNYLTIILSKNKNIFDILFNIFYNNDNFDVNWIYHKRFSKIKKVDNHVKKKILWISI